MNQHIKSFAGYCPKCDKKIEQDASFCHHCGHCLIRNSSPLDAKQNKSVDPRTIQKLLVETTNLFMGWIFAFSLVMASGIFYHFYHQASFLIATGVIFFYCWIFLVSKLDELASSAHKKSSILVYAALLIPVIGTIISYYKVAQVAKRYSA